MTLTKKKTCKDLVNESYESLLDEWSEVINRNESLFEYVVENVLCFDYVEAETFTDQKKDYYRLQLSWGGPSDEFRIYTDKDLNIDYVQYWYLDWYDGASIMVKHKIVLEVLNEFLSMASDEYRIYTNKESV